MPLEIVFLNTMEMLLPAIVITVLGLPLVRVLARRLDRRDSVNPPNLSRIEERLGRLEAGVDAIAVEVERISEGQRFTTKLLADRVEPPGVDEAPPSVRERLLGPDGGADVPADDAQPRRRHYLTDPASRPWTK